MTSGSSMAPVPGQYKTAEGMDIKVSVFANIEYPYSMAFLPSGELLVTTRTGELRLIDKAGKSQLVTGGPPSVFRGKSGSLGAVHGYMNLVVHPQFAQNKLIYFFAHKPDGEAGYTGVLVKARLNGLKLENVTELLAGEGIRGAAALTMTPDGLLWVGSGGDAAAQDPKVLKWQDPAAHGRWKARARHSLRWQGWLSARDLLDGPPRHARAHHAPHDE